MIHIDLAHLLSPREIRMLKLKNRMAEAPIRPDPARHEG